MKRYLLISMLLTALMSVGLFAQFSGGTGIDNDPFLIATPEDLDNIRDYTGDDHSGVYFLQTADIDLDVEPFNQGDGWVPIGSYESQFKAKYNGGGHTIFNLFIRGASRLALFNYLGETIFENIVFENVDIAGYSMIGTLAGISASTVIRDVKVRNVNIVGEDQYVAGLVGYFRDEGSIIENCSVIGGDIFGDGNVGGLVGYVLNHSIIRYSSTDVDISSASNISYNYLGGLVGRLSLGTTNPGTVHNCYARGPVYSPSSTGSRGGLIGRIFGGTVSNSYSTGLINQGSNAGGLIGSVSAGTVVNSYWDTESSSRPTSAGGTGAIGRTTAQMTYPTVNSFTGWDFEDIWAQDNMYIFNDGYPIFIWQVVSIPMELAVNGDEEITINLDEVASFEYWARIYDQNGDPMDNEVVIWWLQDIVGDNVSEDRLRIDQEGVVTVDPVALVGTIRVLAISVTNPDLMGAMDVSLIIPPYPNSITIEGAEYLYYPVEDNVTHTYSAIIYDQYNEIMLEESTGWSIEIIEGNNSDFITMDEEGVLTITVGAESGSILVNAHVITNPEITANMTVAILEPAVLSDIAIEGPETVGIPYAGEMSYQYMVNFYDQHGNQFPEAAVTWSLADNYIGVNINPEGLLTLDTDAEEGLINIMAELTDNSEINDTFAVSLVFYQLLPPYDLTAELTGTEILLDWSSPLRLQLLGFNLYRNDIQINEALITQTYYIDDSGIEEENYTYYVTAVYNFGESEPSNEVTIQFLNAVEQTAKPFEVIGNYPNPFNPSTTISFNVNKESNISVNIYNQKGQLVRELINQVLPPKTHSIMWDGKDFNSQTVASGVYFFTVSTDNERISRKMLLIK